MKNSMNIFIIIVFGLISMPYCQGQSKSKQSRVMKFKTLTYIDEQGTGIEAFRMIIPSDWKFEGGIRWILDNPSMPAIAQFRVYNPDELQEFEVFPNQPFFWTTNQMTLSLFPIGSRYFGSEVLPPMSVLDALEKIILLRFRNNVEDLKIIKKEVLPDLARALGAGTQSQPGLNASAEGGKIKIEYVRNGVETEEEIYAVVELLSFPIQTMYGYVTNTIWFVDYILSFKTEKGKFNSCQSVFQTISYSFKLNPVWYSKYNQVIEYLAQQQIQQIKSIGQLSRILSQTSNEISDMMMESYNQRQQVNERISENFSQYIRGVDVYYNPLESKRVELPAGYDNVWVNSLGEYVVSDNPNYNPNVGSNLTWQKIERAK